MHTVRQRVGIANKNLSKLHLLNEKSSPVLKVANKFPLTHQPHCVSRTTLSKAFATWSMLCEFSPAIEMRPFLVR